MEIYGPGAEISHETLIRFNIDQILQKEHSEHDRVMTEEEYYLRSNKLGQLCAC